MDVTFSERLRVHSELVYTRKGSGEPLVLIHGIGHRRQAWDPVFERLAESYDVIAVDLAGFGESPAYPHGVGYNMPNAVDNLPDGSSTQIVDRQSELIRETCEFQHIPVAEGLTAASVHHFQHTHRPRRRAPREPPGVQGRPPRRP